jgi:hypothetical protein
MVSVILIHIFILQSFLQLHVMILFLLRNQAQFGLAASKDVHYGLSQRSSFAFTQTISRVNALLSK